MAQNDIVFYVSWVLAVMISIVLHELGHGFAAIWQGDDTPIHMKRMNGNPFVHMGVFSIICLLVVGIAWGMMPVNPSRFRSKYGDAIVSFAGPAVNIVLAIIGLLIVGFWIAIALGGNEVMMSLIMLNLEVGSGLMPSKYISETPFLQNVFQFFLLFGMLNIILAIFNLIPIPPLDGSSILANFSSTFRGIVHNPDGSQQIAFLVGFLVLFMIGFEYIFKVGILATNYFLLGMLNLLT